MVFTEEQIKSLSPTAGAFSSGKKLSGENNWEEFAKSSRSLWGKIRGSGKNPYSVQIDLNNMAYKCSCPSRQFPCKHSIALMLLYVQKGGNIKESEDEPEWVKSWMDKRIARAEKKEDVSKETERTPEAEKKLKKSRDDNFDKRFQSVKEGIDELELWLRDLVRIGLLELPFKPKADYEKVAARMVDAKAPGLAGWVRSFTKLNFQETEEWKDKALKTIGKLFMLIKSFKNYENLDPLWQITLRNLVGWNQSPKDLLSIPEAETIKDQWLIVGRELEENDGITVQRDWLVGCNSNRKALILNFATKYNAIENILLPGSIIEAELAYFPSITPQRAIVKMQRCLVEQLNKMPDFFQDWEEVAKYKSECLTRNPWINDLVIPLQKALLIHKNDKWIICDQKKRYYSIIDNYNQEELLNWKVIAGNNPMDIVLVLRNEEVLPLGVFENNKYILL